MTDSLWPVLMIIMMAITIAGSMLVLTHLFNLYLGKRKAKIDKTPYECGMDPFERSRRHRFSVHFYLVAMLFILFDIEAAFMYPWAVTFKSFAENRLFVLGEMAVFLGILIVGFVYLWMRGALEWE